MAQLRTPHATSPRRTGWLNVKLRRPNRDEPDESSRDMKSENILMAASPHLDLRPGITEPVVLLISRSEVEAGDIASVLFRLEVFVANREDAWRYRGQMALVVDGYNDDPRELVDIPEVRSLLQQLEAGWPYWAHFLNQVDDSIKLMLSCVLTTM